MLGKNYLAALLSLSSINEKDKKKESCKVSVKAMGNAAAHSWHDAFVCGYFSLFNDGRAQWGIWNEQGFSVM